MLVADDPPTETLWEAPPRDPVEAAVARGPVTVIEPRPGWRAIDFKELWQYRELIFFLTWRDVKVRYKQTVLGAAWAILQPVLTMVVFVILFGKMGRMEEAVDGSFAIYVYAALLPWQFFASSVSQGAQSLVGSANLISKVYFPRLIIPIASVGAALVDLLLSCGVMAILMVAFGVVPTWRVLTLPLLLMGVILTSIGVGSLLSALTVAYRDFKYVVPFLIQMWMFASPVGYPMSKVAEYVGRRFPATSDIWLATYSLNPLAGLIGGFRWALLGESLNPLHFTISLLAGLSVLVVGVFYFRKVERRFADIV